MYAAARTTDSKLLLQQQQQAQRPRIRGCRDCHGAASSLVPLSKLYHSQTTTTVRVCVYASFLSEVARSKLQPRLLKAAARWQPFAVSEVRLPCTNLLALAPTYTTSRLRSSLLFVFARPHVRCLR